MAVTYKEVDSFVKDTHYYNSERTTVGKILIKSNGNQYFKSVPLKLKERKMCGDLSNGLFLQEINISQLKFMDRSRK